MKIILPLLLLALAAPAFAQAQGAGPEATVGCGSPKVDWDVTTDNNSHTTAAPDATKAHVYFIQDDTNYIPHPRPSTRFGIDGQWVGATHSNSYFFVSVDPGDHQVCIEWQGMVGAGGLRKQSYLEFTAVAGADYYFDADDIYSGGQHSSAQPMVVFTPMDRDQAMALMSRYAYATSTPKTK